MRETPAAVLLARVKNITTRKIKIRKAESEMHEY